MVSWEQKRRQILGDDKKKKKVTQVISKSYRSLERRIIFFVMILFKTFRTCIPKLDMQK